MTPKEKQIQFVVKLLRMTVEGRLAWRKADDAQFGEDDNASCLEQYEAVVGGMELHLAKKTRRSVNALLEMHNFWKASASDRPRITEQTTLRVTDPETGASETFTNLDVVSDLYNAVRKTVPNLDRQIDAFLKEDVTHAQ